MDKINNGDNQLNSSEFNENPNEPEKKNKWWIWIILGVAVILLVIAGIIIYQYYQPKTNANQMEEAKLGPKEEEQKVNNEEKKPAPLIRYGTMKLISEDEEIKVGDKFTVAIKIDTKESNIVLAAGRIKYDTTKLQLEKIEPKDSVLSFSIVQESEAGQIEIVRGAPGNANPNDTGNGYTGTDGLFADLQFIAKQAGVTKIEFSPKDSSLLLDDGLATKMIMTYENAEVVIE